jgi:YesN/AraC family two-component response regulator
MGYNTVIHIDYVEPANNITYRYPVEKEDRLVYSAAVGEYEYSRKLLRDLFDALKEAEPLPKHLISNIIMDILIAMNRFLSERSGGQPGQIAEFFPAKEVLRLENLDEAYTFMNEALRKFCTHVVATAQERNGQIVACVKNQLQEKYYQNPTLSQLALTAGTTPDYLNKIFKEAEGIPVADYLLAVRMAEAKRLLRETAADDDMIAAKLGYENGKQFRAVFRKTEKVGTAEYRQQGR